MADAFTFRVRTGEDLDVVFRDIPPEVKIFLKRGFTLLTTIPQEKYSDLIATAAANLDASHLAPKLTAEIASSLSITGTDAVALLALASLIVSVLAQRQDTPEDFVEAARKAGILEPGAVQASLGFARLVQTDRGPLALTIERARIGVAVLPSFQQLTTTTDVRLGFKKGRSDLAVPVVIAALATDSTKNLWFQLTKGQLEQLIARLQEAKGELEAAERWIQRTDGGSG
jgi:hypothetical protein